MARSTRAASRASQAGGRSGGGRASHGARRPLGDFSGRGRPHFTLIHGYLNEDLNEDLDEDVDEVGDEVDDAIVYGPGLRWAFMGVCLTFHLAGGETGMKHMLEQFGPALKLPWTKLKAPELSSKLKESMISGTKKQAGKFSIKAVSYTHLTLPTKA